MTSPSISVVVASAAGGEFLFRCLESLRRQAAGDRVEVLVVDRCGEDTRRRLARDCSFARVISTEPLQRTSVPELRLLGALEASGDVVAVLEEHCVAPPDWIENIRRSFEPGDAAIGGPILDDDFARIRDWVVYFSEYHNFLPPWSDGPRASLNGANIAYDRELLLRHRELLGQGYWEVVLHPRMAASGRLRALQCLGVRHTGPFDYGYYLRQRYLLSRVWGGAQRERVSASRRAVYLVAAPLFPALLLGRIASRVLAKRRRIARFLSALPLLVPVAVAYVWGEWRGYAFGMGDALEHVE